MLHTFVKVLKDGWENNDDKQNAVGGKEMAGISSFVNVNQTEHNNAHFIIPYMP